MTGAQLHLGGYQIRINGYTTPVIGFRIESVHVVEGGPTRLPGPWIVHSVSTAHGPLHYYLHPGDQWSTEHHAWDDWDEAVSVFNASILQR